MCDVQKRKISKKKQILLFDPCAFPSSCCTWTLIRSPKLKRPKNGRCGKTPDTHSYTPHQFMSWCPSFLRMFSPIASSSCLLFCSVIVLVSAFERLSTPLWALFQFFFSRGKKKVKNQLPPDLIDYKLNELQPSIDPFWSVSILTPTAAEYKWLAVHSAADRPQQYLEVIHWRCATLADGPSN